MASYDYSCLRVLLEIVFSQQPRRQSDGAEDDKPIRAATSPTLFSPTVVALHSRRRRRHRFLDELSISLSLPSRAFYAYPAHIAILGF